MTVRRLVETDITQITELYWEHMRGRRGSAPAPLALAFRELYFANPWIDGESPSFVYENKSGKVVGFLGIIVRRMSIGGQPIRVSFGGNFVVHPEARTGLAAPRLLGAYVSGKHDLLLTDSANDITRRLLERSSFRTIPALNIHWSRVLQPSHCVVYALSRVAPAAIGAGLRLAMKPACIVADAVAVRLPASPFCRTVSHLRGEELDVETLLQCCGEFRKGYSMWAEYDHRSLGWLLGFIARRSSRGVLRKIALRDQERKIVGCYIYYARRGGVGEVVQICGQPKSTRDILDHLFQDAWQQGVIALQGVTDFRRMTDFSDKGCFFTCRGGWTLAKSANPEVLELLESGEGFITRLDGEWCLDPGQ